ncbi:hypothetical protein ANRL1_01392 [Anaerolineae bacterium]|nr:hypothetical protein ANRL1_01392 [Anaerolineae bacterium]
MSKALLWVILGAFVLIGLTTLWMTSPSVTSAQCGSIESSCVKCHQSTHPVCGTTEWHSEYGHRYGCWNCHGGNDTAQDKELAHVSLVRHPLEDAYASCYVCHPEDYKQLAERFAKTLGVTVSAREPAARSVVSAAVVAVRPSPLVVPSAVPADSFDWVWTLWLTPVPVVLVLVWVIWKCKTG